MPPSHKAPHAAAVREPRRLAKQPQRRSPSPDHAVGKSSSACTSASNGAAALAAQRLLKGKGGPQRAVPSATVRSSNAQPKAKASTAWRTKLLHLATQEAYTAATLLRLLPSPVPANVWDGGQPNQLLTSTSEPLPLPSPAGAPEGARAKTAQTAGFAGRSASDAWPRTVPAATTEAVSTPVQIVERTSYGELWEGLLACLPLVNSSFNVAKSTPARGRNSDDEENTGSGRQHCGEPASQRSDKKAASGRVNRPIADVSAMFCTLSNDWRSFFLHRRLSASATAGSPVRSTVPAQGYQGTARQKRRRLVSLACSSHLTHAEQRAIGRYAATAIATMSSGARRGLSPVCVLDLL
ncbi:hypothetical protein, unknown function [Leishmania tarentolae]|uniref:Uncharacterized protein n=1 Tax=Leishmania tarentolae TaxID=5689 RepID=A0A640K997_LEITA|nr:hypothetical protein, unknown function [Leishmania tarentolae]